MQHDINSAKTVAVDREYYWQPIATCPLGVKVQLINCRSGIAVYGVHRAKDNFWTHWAPLPVFRREDGKQPYPRV
jgi:predicted ribosome-associated RNA-binding protein Tma20